MCGVQSNSAPGPFDSTSSSSATLPQSSPTLKGASKLSNAQAATAAVRATAKRAGLKIDLNGTTDAGGLGVPK